MYVFMYVCMYDMLRYRVVYCSILCYTVICEVYCDMVCMYVCTRVLLINSMPEIRTMYTSLYIPYGRYFFDGSIFTFFTSRVIYKN